MIVYRISPFSGISHGMEINCTLTQLGMYESGKFNIQDVFPNLTADEREFIMTGITPDEWPDE